MVSLLVRKDSDYRSDRNTNTALNAPTPHACGEARFYAYILLFIVKLLLYYIYILKLYLIVIK